MVGMNGWGAQPFMMGVLGGAFDLAARALEGSDPANAALAHSYTVDAANWIRNYGYQPSTKGLYYGAGMVNCQPPISDDSPYCSSGTATGPGGPRVLSAEGLRAIMRAYAFNHDNELAALADTLYAAMFSKPDTGGLNPDGYYIDALDDTGWYMSGPPPAQAAPKYFGMFFGFSGLSAWPAYRPGPGTLFVAGQRGAVPGAVKMEAVATGPDGKVSRTECAASPCTVKLPGKAQGTAIELRYLKPDGAPAASSTQPLILK
jgi:hypothetical protein